MKELNYFDRIYKYSNEELTPIEREQFEIELLVNPSLYEEYQLFLKVKEQLQDDELIEYWQVINEVSRKHVKEKHINNNLIKGFITPKALLPLTIVAILILLLWLLYELH